MKPSQTSLRIQKLLQKKPPMTDAQIARKIGRPGEAGEIRVQKERMATMICKAIRQLYDQEGAYTTPCLAYAVRDGLCPSHHPQILKKRTESCRAARKELSAVDNLPELE